MITRLDPPIWMHTDKGDGIALFMICETGMDIAWICCITKGERAGQCWTRSNADVRFMSNDTIGLIVENPWAHDPNVPIKVTAEGEVM